MSQPVRVGIIGAGWPGAAHAKGYRESGGFRIAAVADLIPQRRQKLIADLAATAGAVREYPDAKQLLSDKQIDAVSVCLPTYLHTPTVIAALRAGKHVICEKPPALDASEAKRMAKAAEKAKKVLLYAVQRRFGGPEQASRQAISKGYAGEVFHARAQWLRTRGIPIGTGWFPVKEKSGGGALIDIGVHMLDLAWHLLGQPKPSAVFATIYHKFKHLAPKNIEMDVEDSAFALVRFEGANRWSSRRAGRSTNRPSSRARSAASTATKPPSMSTPPAAPKSSAISTATVKPSQPPCRPACRRACRPYPAFPRVHPRQGAADDRPSGRRRADADGRCDLQEREDG